MIYNDVAAADCGICLEQALAARVYDNSVFHTGAAMGNAIEYRFANSMVDVRGNMANELVLRDSTRPTVDHNQTPVSAAMFRAPTVGDLHLSGTGGAPQFGIPIDGVAADFDGQERSATRPMIGADELPPR